MTITYHSGGRIQATAADLAGTPAVSGGWKEVARTTLGSNNANINVSSIPDKRYYMILSDITLTGAGTGGGARLGSGSVDSSGNYAQRWSANGAADGASGGYSNYHPVGGYSNSDEFYVTYIANKSDEEKLIQTHRVYGLGGGAGNDPKRAEYVAKWVNANPLDYINYYQGGSDQYANGSEIVVLGWDETDTHTTNFWEELADVNLGSSATTLSTGTFTAKKYLWFQTYMKSGNCDYRLTFNGDSGSNYTTRWSENGGSDVTSTSAAFNYLSPQGASTPRFTNTFMINNSANEKLGISHVALQNTAGAGTAPERDEVVHKWANTSAQITSLTVAASINTLSAGTQIKVWGSD